MFLALMKLLLPFPPRFRMGGKVETTPTTLPPNVQHYEMKNLRAGVFYHFWLTATNQKGEGEATPKVGHRVGVSSKDESVRSKLIILPIHHYILFVVWGRNSLQKALARYITWN